MLIAEGVLNYLGKVPRFMLRDLVILNINGPGSGSRASSSPEDLSISMNTGSTFVRAGFELMLHEAGHIALDYLHRERRWIWAQYLDQTFVSTYAEENRDYEDVTESFAAWIYLQYMSASDELAQKIRAAIPNRLRVFDDEIRKLEIRYEMEVEDRSEEMKTKDKIALDKGQVRYPLVANQADLELLASDLEALKNSVAQLQTQNEKQRKQIANMKKKLNKRR